MKKKTFIIVAIVVLALLLSGGILGLLYHNRMLPGQRSNHQHYIDRISRNFDRIAEIASERGLMLAMPKMNLGPDDFSEYPPEVLDEELPQLDEVVRTLREFLENHDTLDMETMALFMDQFFELTLRLNGMAAKLK